ncbi:potassium/proton antiporter [Mariniluteicoccus endophyticus]
MAMDLDQLMLVGSAVVMVAIVSSRIGSWMGLPSLLLFLGLGIGLGEAGFGIQFEDASLAHSLGFAALVLILAEGGLTTRWVEIKGAIPVAGLLATAGIGVSVGACFLFGHVVLGLDPWIAVLLGAVCSPTDSAAVFSVLRKVPLPSRLRSTLEAESGLNDAPTVLLVSAASAYAAGHAGEGLGAFVLMVGFELAGGLFIGVVLGWFGVKLLRNIALPSAGLYPLAALVWAILAYGLGVFVHTSGFAAVYVCAVMLGNGGLPHRQATRSFVEGIGWIAQIGLFVMLGLLASPGRITWGTVGMALVFGVFLTLVARPLSVYAAAVWFRVPLREQVFLSWAGLRGAVPIILATVPLVDRVNGAEKLFDVVLVFVVVFTVVQAPTLPWTARMLGLTDAGPTDVEVEVAPMERIHTELVQVRVPEHSQLAGVEIGELRLPRDAVVSLVIRGEEPFAPDERTLLRTGDELLVVTPTRHRMMVEERLREVGQRGRLARWRRGLGAPDEADTD